MQFDEISTIITSYLEKGETFAVAQVIGRQEPTSGKIGDKAVILSSGKLIGWIGGGCVRGIVIKEALEALAQKKHRLVRISPEGKQPIDNNFKNYTMTCHSEGSVSLLIEPVITLPHIILIGKSNICRKLVHVAQACYFPVEVMALEASSHFQETKQLTVKDEIHFDSKKSYRKSYIIIATQGENDEEAVQKALKTDAEYVGLVASKKKASRIKEFLIAQKIPSGRVEMLKSPVGLDIQAKGHSEVAVSILAEIIAHFRADPAISEIKKTTDTKVVQNSSKKPEIFSLDKGASKTFEDVSYGEDFLEEFYINPVCQVPVSKKNPKHVIEYKGESVYFCCDGCKVAFDKEPEKYIKV